MSDRTPIKLPPGVARMGSPAEAKGRWYDAHLVRWVGGVLRPVAGWDRIVTSGDNDGVFASRVRKTHVWMSRDGIVRTAVFCEQHLYVVTAAGEVQDITPTGGIQSPDDPTTGGYGDWYYSDDTYNTARPETATSLTYGAMWSLDNFGDLLVAMASADGRLLTWDPNNPTVLSAQAETSPLGRFFIVTPERHVMVFQDGDAFNRMRWCSQEDITDWDDASLTNSAGMYEIEPAQPFVTGIATRHGVVVFTTGQIYTFAYMGTPYFYAYSLIGSFATPVSGAAICVAADMVVWYSSDGFWKLSGGSSVSSLSCPILDWIQDNIDTKQQYQLPFAFYLGNHSEMWFFFPSNEATVNDRYAIYNFDEDWWSMGFLQRTCGTTGSALTFPLMSDGTNIFRHENGLFYYDAPMLPYAQTAAINVADGGRLSTMRKGIVDTRAPAEDVVFTIGATKSRISDSTTLDDIELKRAVRKAGGKLDFRVTGRDLVIRIESARNGVQPWTFGQMLVAVAQRGGR